MPKKAIAIRTNTMSYNFGAGISIERVSFNNLPDADEVNAEGLDESRSAHREDRHSFFLLESGTVELEIDFIKYTIEPSSVIYMHPDQVHRILALKNVTVSSLAINNENLDPEYLKLLEDIRPAKAVVLTEDTFSIMSETVSLCISYSKRNSDKLYHSLLKHSCNVLVALVVSQYLELVKSTDKSSRFELVTKAFRRLLESGYSTFKRPADYAKELNISTPYLNECVKITTGFPVSYHLQQRVILEAKRLLYHSDRSVKEIAAILGYDDYPYFSRLFKKNTGFTALEFRNKNLD